VNGRAYRGLNPLHIAKSLNVLNALLDRGADPTLVDDNNRSALMYCVVRGEADYVARLLQDPRVQATVDAQDSEEGTHSSSSSLQRLGRIKYTCHGPSSPSRRRQSGPD